VTGVLAGDKLKTPTTGERMRIVKNEIKLFIVRIDYSYLLPMIRTLTIKFPESTARERCP
jgi:hypothetical protein